MTDLLANVVVPVASADVAEQTAEALREYLDADSTVHVVHVVRDESELADASPEEWEAFAVEALTRFEEVYGSDVETEIREGTDIAETILSVAREVGASAVVFKPRGGSRWRQLMSGDVGRTLVSEADRPVVALRAADETSTDEE